MCGSFARRAFDSFFFEALVQQDCALDDFQSAVNNEWTAPTIERQWRCAIGPFESNKIGPAPWTSMYLFCFTEVFVLLVLRGPIYIERRPGPPWSLGATIGRQQFGIYITNLVGSYFFFYSYINFEIIIIVGCRHHYREITRSVWQAVSECKNTGTRLTST